MISRSAMFSIPAVVLFALPSAALAQEILPKEITADKALAAPSADVLQGWAPKLMVGATGSYGHSSNVVGAVDGATIQLGLLVTGKADSRVGQSSWENDLKVNETQTRTPQFKGFLKSADELALQSAYYYHLPNLDWVGPFGRVAATTQLFSSYNVQPKDVTITRTFLDGTTRTKDIPMGDHIQLAKPFEPFLLKEAVGVFANPYVTPPLTIKTKLGVGMQHVIVGQGFALADDKATPELELKQMGDSNQGGGEAEVELTGLVSDNVTWSAKANVFYPFYTSVTTDLSGLELMTTDLAAKISVRLAKWASLDYVLSAKRIPLILDAWQVQNNLLLTVGFNIL